MAASHHAYFFQDLKGLGITIKARKFPNTDPLKIYIMLLCTLVSYIVTICGEIIHHVFEQINWTAEKGHSHNCTSIHHFSRTRCIGSSKIKPVLNCQINI